MECSTRSCDKEEDGDMFGEDIDDDEEDEDGSQELFSPNMAQTLPMPFKKGKEVIEVEHEDSS
eukprot:9785764-Ditylum_brightwellii.AAC.1